MIVLIKIKDFFPISIFLFNPIFFFLNSVLRPFQDHFSSYEMGQSVGGAKMGEPREKTPDTPVSRTWLVSRGQSGARTRTRNSGEKSNF